MRHRRTLATVLSIIICLFTISISAPQLEAKKRSHKARTSLSYKKRSKKRSSGTKRNISRRVTHTPQPTETASNDSLTMLINNAVISRIPDNLNPGGLRVNSVGANMTAHTLEVNLNDNFTYLPVTREFITDLQEIVRRALPDSLRHFSPTLSVGGKSLAYYINRIDPLPREYRANIPFVRETKPQVRASKGLPDDKIALWHSHGRYFKNGAWQWQRPLLFETVEDIYTMGYILPFVTPMLENAGANVFLPRERDTNPREVIVDNDLNPGGQIFSQPYYREITGSHPWQNGEFDGFIYDLPDFRDTENPFELGTYRQTRTIRDGKASIAAWYADIPADDNYAVYISYKSLPNSSTDALYTVNYSGGSKQFFVNQKMGSSTWIYLGTFPLTKGYSDTKPIVTLSNVTTAAEGTIVTADAVKIGGGMGNIARSPHRSDIYYDPSTPINEKEEEEEAEEDTGSDDDVENSDDIDPAAATSEDTSPSKEENKPTGRAPSFRTSSSPRFVEGARYWLHWAGFPEEVYSPYHGRDDYKDDYTGRALWVNYLAGGSRVLPKEQGLGIPIDLTVALHSDAGKRSDDSTVGTLGIYYSNGGASYEDGTPRINSRMLTDLLLRQITGDIRQTLEPDWKRRSMWDKSYVEARIPEVPTALVELLSHQNFGDMVYGLDPEFRFIVSRAIYKAIARFMAERKGRELVIQPLPVFGFTITRTSRRAYRLSWHPRIDKLEKTAVPTKYIVYERTEGELGFHPIGQTTDTHFNLRVSDNNIHSFKIVAANDGGYSFDSEILALRESEHSNAKPILIVNGFDRVSAPGRINTDSQAGFDSHEDFGVPYIRDISFSGHQYEFRRGAGESAGRSDASYAGKVIAGNTFDYPFIHGKSIAAAGYGFISASASAIVNGDLRLRDYETVDLILGKQKESTIGTGMSGWKYSAFPREMQKLLDDYTNHGGNLLVSGQYIASDLYSMRSDASDRQFATEILGIEPASGDKITNPRLDATTELSDMSHTPVYYNNRLNEEIYIVESPDQLMPVGDAKVLLNFNDNGNAAALYNRHGKGNIITLSIPIETITADDVRDKLIKQFLKILND